MLYRTIKRIIENGAPEDLAMKIDIFYVAGKLTDEEYAELTSMLPGDVPELETETEGE